MEIEFTLQPDDLIVYANQHIKSFAKIVRNRTSDGRTLWGTTTVAIVVIGLVLDGGQAGVPFVFVALVLAYFLYQKWHVKRYLKICYSEGFAGDSLKPQKIILGEDSLTSLHWSSRAEYLWRAVAEILHTETHTFIFLQNRTAFVVPRRIFKDQPAFEVFKNELETKWREGRDRLSGQS